MSTPSVTTIVEIQSDQSPAGKSRGAHMLFWITACAVLFVDLWSKHWVFSHLGTRDVHVFIPGFVEFRRSLNDGAVFGSFTGQVGVFIIASLFALGFVLYLFLHSRARQWVLHISLALILAGALGNLHDRAFVIADVVRTKNDAGRSQTVIGKIVGDDSDANVRIGDWPDGQSPRSFLRSEVEVRQQGVVRDFIKFVPTFPASLPRVGGYDIWPWVFNFADAALVCGVIVLMLTSLLDRSPRHGAEAAES